MNNEEPPHSDFFPAGAPDVPAAAWEALRRERFAEAERLLAAAPLTPHGRWCLGVALHGQNRHAEALEQLRSARKALCDGIERWRCGIDIAIAHNKRGAAAHAERVLRCCAAALRALGDAQGVLKCALYQAITLARRGRYTDFLEAFDALRGALAAQPSSELLVIGLVTRCASLYSLHRLDEARETQREGLALARAAGLEYREAVFVYYGLCIATDAGEKPDDAACAGLELLAERSGSAQLMIDCATLRAHIAYTNGDFKRAMEHTERAALAYQRTGYDAGVARCALNLTVCCFALSRYADALRWARDARQHAERAGADDVLALAHLVSGWLHTVFGALPAARAGLVRALDALTRQQQWPHALHAAALLSIADPDHAREWLARAVEIEARSEISGLYPDAVRWMGESRWRLGEISRAQSLFERAARIAERTGKTYERIASELAWSALAVESGGADFGLVRRRVRFALDAEIGAPELSGQAALLHAELLQRQAQPDAALAVLASAAAAATQIRDAIFDPVLAGRVARLQARNYAMGMRAAWRLNNTGLLQAFIAQRRSSGLRWRLADADRSNGVDADALEEAALDALTHERIRRRAAMAGALAGMTPSEQTFDTRQMERPAPAVTTALHGGVPAASDVRARLTARFGDRWSFVSIEPLHPLEQRWLVLLMRPDAPHCTVYSVEDGAPIRHIARLLSAGSRQWSGTTYADTKASHSLRQKLAQALHIDAWMRGHDARTLIIADTWPFSDIALDALPLASGRLLGEQTTVLYAPQAWSPTTGAAGRDARGTGAPLRVLVFAPGRFGARHPELPASTRDVALARALWPQAHVLEAAQATRAALRGLARDGALAAFDLIVLSTHMVFDAELPRLSALACADGDLSVHEIARWRLNADLVCVGACDAARNAVLGGEERLGLEQTLLHCGARHVLGPLWPVSDALAGQFTAAVLRRYQACQDGLRAYRLARQELRAQLPLTDWAVWRMSAAV